MQAYFERVVERGRSEQGAEIVEWVLWVGGIALLAGAMFTLLSGELNTLATSIITNMGVISGS